MSDSSSLISIKRVGTKVELDFNSELALEKPVFPFSFECGNEYSAELLSNWLSEKFNDTLCSIRKQEYERGYEDGKRKKARADWFYATFKPHRYWERK